MSRGGPGLQGRARSRWGIASRVLAATLGAYGVASLLSAVLALALPRFTPISQADAVLYASLLSFALYTGVAIGVFATRSAARACGGLAVAALLGGAALALLQAAG